MNGSPWFSGFLSFGVFLLGFSSYAQAPAAASETELQPLHVVYSKAKTPVKVSVQFKLEGDELHAHYETLNSHINAKPKLNPGQYPYQFDTVELFLSVNESSPNLPYYEFEVSPYNQTFLVKILDPKKPFVDNFQVSGFQSSVSPIPGGWSADLRIPLSALHWNGDVTKITGNAYAISGASPLRSYFGLTLPVEAKPNFHLPQYFQPLFPLNDK